MKIHSVRHNNRDSSRAAASGESCESPAVVRINRINHQVEGPAVAKANRCEVTDIACRQPTDTE